MHLNKPTWLGATISDGAILNHPDQHIQFTPTMSHLLTISSHPNAWTHFSDDSTEATEDKLLAQKSHSRSTAEPGRQYKPPHYADLSPTDTSISEMKLRYKY